MFNNGLKIWLELVVGRANIGEISEIKVVFRGMIRLETVIKT